MRLTVKCDKQSGAKVTKLYKEVLGADGSVKKGYHWCKECKTLKEFKQRVLDRALVLTVLNFSEDNTGTLMSDFIEANHEVLLGGAPDYFTSGVALGELSISDGILEWFNGREKQSSGRGYGGRTLLLALASMVGEGALSASTLKKEEENEKEYQRALKEYMEV